MAKKTYPIATKALTKHKSEVIDAEATVVKKSRKKKPVEKEAEPELKGWAYKKAHFGWIVNNQCRIAALYDKKNNISLGYIVSRTPEAKPRDWTSSADYWIFPKRPPKKPVEIFCVPLDFDFSAFGESCEFTGACGCFDIDELPKDFELPEFIQAEVIKAEFEIIKDKLKTLSHSKFKAAKAAATQALEVIGSLDKKLHEEVKPMII